MSIISGLDVECVSCLTRACRTCQEGLCPADFESESWSLASGDEFEPVPRMCRYIRSVYEDDIRNPLRAPPGGYGINPDWVILRKAYGDNQGRVTPYMIYLDHDHAEIVLAVRGLNLQVRSDYAIILDDQPGQAGFQGGYVHNGLWKAAGWVFAAEFDVLRHLVAENPTYALIFTGHSAGVVALLTLIALHNQDKLGIERNRIKCYALAPARCMSLDLAVSYADVIDSVVLQDDFLPRTTTALEDVYKSLLCFPWLCPMSLEKKMRLYAPGRLYHIVERKPGMAGRFPPVVRTAVPVEGRFEHLVLSCNVASDHAIICIEREAQRALDLMRENGQLRERNETVARHNQEYEAALQMAVALGIAQAYSPSSNGTFHEIDAREDSASSSGRASSSSSPKRNDCWNEFVDRLFDIDDRLFDVDGMVVLAIYAQQYE